MNVGKKKVKMTLITVLFRGTLPIIAVNENYQSEK